ncbi:hypothetical protein [Streptomyces sp. NPDC001222]|uniref:hypothetical protein n=1 Tax=Streptomyces sp. NPDC001222 TaxID=3364548 RepID=UPI00367A22D1
MRLRELVLTQRLSPPSCPARPLVLAQLDVWGIPHGIGTADAVAAIVTELAAHAVAHERVPRRYFELRVSLRIKSVRIEVTDILGHRRPPGTWNVREAAPLARRPS